MSGVRYAVYFVPAPASALYRFGAAALGYDCWRGAEVPFLNELESNEADWSVLTREPRTYGFHATLKAPFRLRDDVHESNLVDAFTRFAASRHGVPRFAPRLRLIGRFVAVIPDAMPADLADLADASVSAFESFRAPLSAPERQRRVEAGLEPRQIAYLDRWGYPYVFDEFRFHMTLTGPLPTDRAAGIRDRLEALFVRACGGGPVAVDRLGLLRQNNAGERFALIAHLPIRCD